MKRGGRPAIRFTERRQSKSNTMFLQSKGRNKENIYRKLCARSWSAEARDCTVTEGTEIMTEG